MTRGSRLTSGKFIAIIFAFMMAAPGASALECTLSLLDAKPGTWKRIDSTNRTDWLVVVSNTGSGRKKIVKVQTVTRIHDPASESNTVTVYGGAYIEDNSIDEVVGEETVLAAGKAYKCRIVEYTVPTEGFGGVTVRFWISDDVPINGVVKAEQLIDGESNTWPGFSSYGFTRPEGLPPPEGAAVLELLELSEEALSDEGDADGK